MSTHGELARAGAFFLAIGAALAGCQSLLDSDWVSTNPGKWTSTAAFAAPESRSLPAAEGNHRVVVEARGAAPGATLTIKAETRRLMVHEASLLEHEASTFEFLVNVRTACLGDGRAVALNQRELDNERVTWDDHLALEFLGEGAIIDSITIEPAPQAPTVYLLGDSTVCDQPGEPWSSWGQSLPSLLRPEVAVANHAQSGESIRSSLAGNRIEKVYSLLRPGDWLLVQFGHNDMKSMDPGALDLYEADLRDIVREARARGAEPILVTSMERKAGRDADTLAGYPDAVRLVAADMGVVLVDLHARSKQLYRALGEDLGEAFMDGTHHSNYGSLLLARIVAADLASSSSPLGDFVVPEARRFDAGNPPPPGAIAFPPSFAIEQRDPPAARLPCVDE